MEVNESYQEKEREKYTLKCNYALIDAQKLHLVPIS